MKRVKLLIATAVASVCMSITALAGAWKADNDQWKFLKDDGNGLMIILTELLNVSILMKTATS